MSVPGALEIPLALQTLALGAAASAAASTRWSPSAPVVRGETYHFEIVANESARGILDVQLETGIPDRQRRAHDQHRRAGAARGARSRARRRRASRSRWPTPEGHRRMTLARRRSREFALQGLYQWQYTGTDASQVLKNLSELRASEGRPGFLEAELKGDHRERRGCASSSSRSPTASGTR
jgi:hypothetical protein